MKDESRFSDASKWVDGCGLCLKGRPEEDVLGSTLKDWMIKTENPSRVLGIVGCLISFSSAERVLLIPLHVERLYVDFWNICGISQWVL